MLPLPKSKEFPLALKKYRERKGLSFKQLSELTGITTYRLERYEGYKLSSHVGPKFKIWRLLNKVLGIEIDEEEFKRLIEPKKKVPRPISRLPFIRRSVLKTKCVPDPNVKQSYWFPS